MSKESGGRKESLMRVTRKDEYENEDKERIMRLNRTLGHTNLLLYICS
jgi:hypothetical protein